jgi:5'-nucleotidase/UDP-sugar diphosphatase
VLLGAGSVRVRELGPAVSLMDLLACFPYDDALTRYMVSGATLKKVFAHWMRPENRTGEGECYQVNSSVRASYSNSRRELVSLEINGAPVADETVFRLILQGYHAKNSRLYLDVGPEELTIHAPSRILATSAQTVLKEWLGTHQNESRKVEGRLVYQD